MSSPNQEECVVQATRRSPDDEENRKFGEKLVVRKQRPCFHRPWDSDPSLGDHIAELIEARLCNAILRTNAPQLSRPFSGEKMANSFDFHKLAQTFNAFKRPPISIWNYNFQPFSFPNIQPFFNYSFPNTHFPENWKNIEKPDFGQILPDEFPARNKRSVSVEFINNGHGIRNPYIGAAKKPKKSNSIDQKRMQPSKSQPTFPVKRFLCSTCGKGFNDTFDLKRHTRTHTGVRPYKCEHCDKSFTQRCSLETHAKKLHGVKYEFGYKERRTKLYVCEECGDSTAKIEEHYKHVQMNHPALMLQQQHLVD